MGKLTRREFIKYALMLGAIAPIFDIELLKKNLDKFTHEQLSSIKDIESIELSDCSPYYLQPSHTWNNEYYDIELKNGQRLWLSDIQIKERYGDILDYFIDSDYKPTDAPPAIWNS
jgi:hypothetical protein